MSIGRHPQSPRLRRNRPCRNPLLRRRVTASRLSCAGKARRACRRASFSVALRVSTQEPLRATPMQLRYPHGVLEPLEVRPGKFIGKGAFSYRVSEGSIFVGALAPSTAPGADAELVVLTFRPLKQGTTAELSMSALSLQGPAGRAIAHEQPAAFRAPIQ